MSEPKSLKYQSLVAFVNALALDERIEFLGYVKEKLDSDVVQKKLLQESKTLKDKFYNLNSFIRYPKLFGVIFDEIISEKNLKDLEALMSEDPSIFRGATFKSIFEDLKNEIPEPLSILLKRIRELKNKKYEKVVAFFVDDILNGFLEIPGTELLFSKLLFEFGAHLNEDNLGYIFYTILEGPTSARSTNHITQILDSHIHNKVLEYFVEKGVWRIPRHCGISQMRHICKRLRIPKYQGMDFGEMFRAVTDLPKNKRVFYFKKVMKYKDYFGDENKVKLVGWNDKSKEYIAESDFRGCIRVENDGKSYWKNARYSKTYGWSVIINTERYKVEKLNK